MTIASAMFFGMVLPLFMAPFSYRDLVTDMEDQNQVGKKTKHIVQNMLFRAFLQDTTIFDRICLMPKSIIGITFDGEHRLQFVTGEDRIFLLRFTDKDTGLPMDLTQMNMALHLPRYGGGTIKRKSFPVQVSSTFAIQTASVAATMGYRITSHGFVTGDTVVATSDTGSMLPASLVNGDSYMVVTIDADSFYLVGTSGQDVSPETPGPYQFFLQLENVFSLSVPTAGQVDLTLSSEVTSQVATGQALDFQVVLTDQNQLTRIVLGTNLLDCLPQPLP